MIRKTSSFLLFLLCCLTSRAQQIYDLPLSKPVTNDTEQVTGEGVFGLQRSFKKAGV